MIPLFHCASYSRWNGITNTRFVRLVTYVICSKNLSVDLLRFWMLRNIARLCPSGSYSFLMTLLSYVVCLAVVLCNSLWLCMEDIILSKEDCGGGWGVYSYIFTHLTLWVVSMKWISPIIIHISRLGTPVALPFAYYVWVGVLMKFCNPSELSCMYMSIITSHTHTCMHICTCTHMYMCGCIQSLTLHDSCSLWEQYSSTMWSWK